LKIPHRDISSKSVKFDENDVPKLFDNGEGRISAGKSITASSLFHGSQLYRPPESAIEEFTYPKDLILAADIWQVGILLYEMMDPPLTLNKAVDIQNQNFSSISKLNYTDDLKNLMQTLCKADPKSRPSIGEVLNFPIFHELNVNTSLELLIEL